MRLMLFVFLLAFSFSANAQKVIRISTANALQKSLWQKIAEPFKKETGYTFTFTDTRMAPGYFKDLLDDKVDAAVAITSYSDWMKWCEKDGVKAPPGVEITHRVIAKDLFDVVVHKDVGVAKLNEQQIKDIFTGKVTNWKQLGGADVAISMFISADKPSISGNFNKLVLNNEGFAKSMKTNEKLEQTYEIMAKTPGSVTLDNNEIKNPMLKALEIPDLGRPITMVTKGRPSPAVEQLISFIRNKGPSLGVGRN